MAKTRQASPSRRWKAAAAAEPARTTGLPANPFARQSTESFVLVSPSTEIQLKDGSTARTSARWRVLCSITASVVRYASIVAMSG